MKTRASSPTGEGPFTELASDAGLEVLDDLEEKVTKEWPDLVRAGEKEKARQILIDLVDENVERLAAKLEAFNEKIDELAETAHDPSQLRSQPAGRTAAELPAEIQEWARARDQELEEVQGGEGQRRMERAAERGGRTTASARGCRSFVGV